MPASATTEDSTTMPTERTSRALELFDELVELDPQQRQARLAALRAQAPALAGEVEAMLAADDGSGLLDRRGGSIAATVLGQARQADAGRFAAAVGERLGAFVLRHPLGAGGMGEVWLAERETGEFRQEVALKLLRRAGGSPDSLRRFQQERRILADLSHPNIARFIDGGVENGQPWYAMARVQGRPITEWAEACRLDLRQRVALMLPVCEAVAYAQARLVVHRDLKPSNILVDEGGQPQLLDFGIAKLLDLPEDARETATGVLALSPAYAAPEQVLGETISTATDVYALGVVLYELLTGRLPNERAASSLETLAERVRNETIERPSQRLRREADTALARRARELDGDLDLILLTCLRREPERRYAGASALGEDLRRWLEGRPIAARADTTGYRLRKFVARNRYAVGSASAVLLALIAGFGVALWQAQLAREQAARAEQAAAAARQQAERVKKVKDFLMSIFVVEDPLRRGADAPADLRAVYTRTLERIDTEFAGDPALQADLLDDFGEIEAGRGDLAAGEVLIARALALAEQAHGPDHPAVAESLLNLGVLKGWSGRWLEGEPNLERAIGILRRAGEAERKPLATALGGLAALRQQQGRMSDAIELLRESMQLHLALPEPDLRDIAVSHTNLAILLNANGRDEEAEAELRQAMALSEKVNGVDNPNLVPMYDTLAAILHTRGDLAGERVAAERSLALARKNFPGDHEWVARALGEAGALMARDGEVEPGLARLGESLAMYERLGDTRRFVVHRRMAVLLTPLGRLDEALQHFDQASALCTAHTPSSQGCLQTRANRAQLLAQVGRAQEGLAEADAVLALIGAGEALHSQAAQAQEARADALAGLGRGAEASAAQAEALRLYQRRLDPGHPAVESARQRLLQLDPDA
jgi:eukaryotic-like serine/threonine-protein kinase